MKNSHVAYEFDLCFAHHKLLEEYSPIWNGNLFATQCHTHTQHLIVVYDKCCCCHLMKWDNVVIKMHWWIPISNHTNTLCVMCTTHHTTIIWKWQVLNVPAAAAAVRLNQSRLKLLVMWWHAHSNPIIDANQFYWTWHMHLQNVHIARMCATFMLMLIMLHHQICDSIN